MRRFEILMAAHKLFTERGFDRVSMEDVANKVGISKAALYRYYKSKVELFGAMIRQGMDKLIADLDAVLADESKKILAERVDAAYEGLLEYYPVITTVRRVFETGGPPSIPRRRLKQFMQDMQIRRDRIRSLFAEVFVRAQKEGEVEKNLPAKELAGIFMGFVTAVAALRVDFNTAREVFLKGILVKELKQ